MNSNSRVLFFVIFVSLLLFSSAYARFLITPGQDENELKGDQVTLASSSTEKKDEITNLMGSEDCDEKDEECLKRRMIADAHLDYIYTQHHKP